MKKSLKILFTLVFLNLMMTSTFAASTVPITQYATGPVVRQDIYMTKENTKDFLSYPLTDAIKEACGKKRGVYDPDSLYMLSNYASGNVFIHLQACVAQGIIKSAIFYNSPYELGARPINVRGCHGGYDGNSSVNGGGCSYTVTINTCEDVSKGMVNKQDKEYIEFMGTTTCEGGITQTIQSGLFNSPYIYINNAPKGEIEVKINSAEDTYANLKPPFNLENGWKVASDGDNNLFVNDEKTDSLFYELALKKVELTRNGRNFSTKVELTDFLENSEFFDKMGYTEQQKADTLTYIVPRIEDSKNYYLTILDEEAVNDLSSLDITPKPKNLTRNFYAIYPTDTVVRTNGDLLYPNITEIDGYNVVENGEIYIDDGIVVIWK